MAASAKLNPPMNVLISISCGRLDAGFHLNECGIQSKKTLLVNRQVEGLGNEAIGKNKCEQ